MTLGFIVGKFYPPHRGHSHLIRMARPQVDRLVVMVAHHPSQTIPGELRREWLKELHPDCEIHLVPDDLPNESAPWATFVRNYLRRSPDIVFTSEDYGAEFARLMGSRHVLVDRERGAVPVSGTQIRSAPLDHLSLLEPCIRAWYVRRVVLIGAESTGKTTLAGLLAERFRTDWVPEYGRKHWERKLEGLTLSDPPPAWTQDEFVEIAREQQRRENQAAGSANRILFCDTNAFATGTWHERYRGCRHREVDQIGARDVAHLYLLTEPDIPFVQDGVRDGELIRDWMHNRFLKQLQGGKVPLRIIRGNFEQRLHAALAAIREELGLEPPE